MKLCFQRPLNYVMKCCRYFLVCIETQEIQGPRNGFQLTGAQSAISAGGGCLNQAPSPWPQIGPKLTGAWHPLLKIDGCTGTRGTRSYEDPGMILDNCTIWILDNCPVVEI